jgi:hypothetical protein
MLEQFRPDPTDDCYRRAAEARHKAAAAMNSHARSDFLDFERHWLHLARGFESPKCKRVPPQIPMAALSLPRAPCKYGFFNRCNNDGLQ